MVDAATQAATDFFAISPRCSAPAPAVLFDANTQTVTYVSQPRVVEVVVPGLDNSAAPFLVCSCLGRARSTAQVVENVARTSVIRSIEQFIDPPVPHVQERNFEIAKVIPKERVSGSFVTNR